MRRPNVLFRPHVDSRLFYTIRSSLRTSAVCLVMVACRAGARGDLEFGQECVEASQCQSHVCLMSGPGAEKGVCAQRCEDGKDCPEGWSCTGLTQKGELVCQEGPATPFGM